jgi:hypothetical protein
MGFPQRAFVENNPGGDLLSHTVTRAVTLLGGAGPHPRAWAAGAGGFPASQSRPGCVAVGGCRRAAVYTKKGPRSRAALVENNPGGDLLSHTVTRAVPSAVAGLTSVFGMGTGVTLLL